MKKAKHGKVKVTYSQTATGIGRYCAQHALSLQCIERRIRHTIFREFNLDLDVFNAHPVLLDQYCDEMAIPHPHLNFNVENCDARGDDVSHGHDEGQCKETSPENYEWRGGVQ